MRLSSSLTLLFAAHASADRASLDCPLRQIALDYAQAIQPKWRPLAALDEFADALNGAEEAVGCAVKPRPNATDAASRSTERVKSFPLPQPGDAALLLFVDPTSRGDDERGDGSSARPFASLARAVAAVRASRAGRAAASLSATDRAVLVLRAGTFFLGSTLHLGAADSHLALQAYPGEAVAISGGLPLDGLSWEAAPEAVPRRQLYEYRAGTLGPGFDAAPTAVMTVAAAQAKCSALPTCAAFTYQDASPAPKQPVKVYFKYEVFWQGGQAGSGWSTHVRNLGYEPGAANLYKADLSQIWPAHRPMPGPLDSLRVRGVRAVRARYPNVKSVEQIGAMQIDALAWTAQSTLNMSKEAKYTYAPASPLRNDTAQDFFQVYRLGVGGDCASRFTPQAAYWCANDTQGGGPGPYSAPVGVTVSNANTSLPHTPYAADNKHASAGSGALIHTWRAGRWFSWVFQGEGAPRHDARTGQTSFDFSLRVGGNQGSRGGDAGQEFFIENVFDELDAPGEFYFDPAAPETGKPTLWLWHNASGPPSSGLVAPFKTVLVNTSGTQAAPVVGVAFRGLTFRDAAPNYLGPHGVPAGGDWAVGRSAALFFEGTEGATVEGCLLTSLDGNAVFLSGYNRRAVVAENEFFSIGETAITQWGHSDGSPVPGMGPDATAGNQPRGTRVVRNLVHELGLWTKQNSFYFQSSSFGNHLEGNLAFNGPRAGINFDDGMGGGSTITRNVLANFCRESSDHGSSAGTSVEASGRLVLRTAGAFSAGPFNSWDRQVYVYDADGAGGAPTVMKRNDTISYNFMLANYHSSMAIDNDDGSAFYNTHHNVFVSASTNAAFGGSSLKNDFGGHSNFHHDNLDLFWSEGFGICPALPGFQDGYYGNYLYLSQDGDYGRGQACTGSAKTVVHGNTVWTPTGNVTECGKSLREWQAEGNDAGTTAAPYPPDHVVLAQARNTLRM